MEVTNNKYFEDKPNYLIEWGFGTWSEDWEEKEFAIRNRYNLPDGRFNRSGSAEVPWSDFNRMITASIQENHFSKNELKEILQQIINKLTE